MFAIATRQDQYLTYLLVDQSAQTQAEVVPERGGILTRWQVQGQNVFYMDEERFTDPTLTVRGGNPILFPICGNLPDNTYTWKDQPYTLKQHGFARNLPWSVGDRTTDDGAALTVELSSTDETRAVYPFEFHVAFTYVLRGNTLEIRQRVTNHSADSMPFSIGFHPYFGVVHKEQLQIQIPATELFDHISKTSHPYSGSFDFAQDEIDVAFPNLTAPTAQVTDPDRRLRLTIDVDPLFSTLVFWTVKGKEFYCLEPWTAGRNAMNTGDRLIHLPSGETLSTSVRLTVDPL